MRMNYNTYELLFIFYTLPCLPNDNMIYGKITLILLGFSQTITSDKGRSLENSSIDTFKRKLKYVSPNYWAQFPPSVLIMSQNLLRYRLDKYSKLMSGHKWHTTTTTSVS